MWLWRSTKDASIKWLKGSGWEGSEGLSKLILLNIEEVINNLVNQVLFLSTKSLSQISLRDQMKSKVDLCKILFMKYIQK